MGFLQELNSTKLNLFFTKDIGESRERALEIGKEKGLMYINGFDHPNILAGQAQ